ncbi:MAG: zinc-binding dehydrogenase [Oscillospiraceae bacterium]
MKAVVLTGPAKLEWLDVPEPEIGPEDILLQVKAAGICGGDLHFYTGAIGAPHGYPLIIGHEFAGVIAAKGERVDPYWKVGDRVVSENTGHACGRCPSCAQGDFVNCPEREILGCSYDGGFTDYVKVPGKVLRLYPNTLMRLPDNIPFPEATVLEPAANAYKAVIQESALHAGETVVVFGPGPLGLMSVQMAKIAGAGTIILVGTSSNRGVRREIGLKYGATHWLESDSGEDIPARIREIAGPAGVAVVIDAVGHPSVLPSALQCVRNEGIIVRVGLNDMPVNCSINALTEKSVTLRGHMGYNSESWRNCISLAEKGILDLSEIITSRLPMHEYETGFQNSMKGLDAKVILIPEGADR